MRTEREKLLAGELSAMRERARDFPEGVLAVGNPCRVVWPVGGGT